MQGCASIRAAGIRSWRPALPYEEEYKTMRKAPSALGSIVALLLVLAIAAVVSQEAQASHGGADAFSLDMDPAGNTATSLGPNDTCVSTTASSTVTVDLTVTNVPPFNDAGTPGVPGDDSGGITGWQASILYSDNGAPLRIETEDQNFLLVSNSGSALFSTSDTLPDNAADNQWTSSSFDIGAGPTPEEGSGVLARLTISVDAAAATGNYDLQVDPSPPPSSHSDASGATFEPHTLNLGTIAVGQACGSAPTPSPSPSPTTAPTTAPTAAPTASPAPTAVRTATPAAPAALPPTGSEAQGASGPASLFLGAAVLLIATLGYGSRELRRRLRAGR
jgi:hypothetical protein